jgi:hypothetical protein
MGSTHMQANCSNVLAASKAVHLATSMTMMLTAGRILHASDHVTDSGLRKHHYCEC